VKLHRSILLSVLLASAAPTAVSTLVLLRAPGSLDRTALLAIAAAFALAVLLAAVVARGVTRPIAECVRGALDIARGRFGREVNVGTRTEIRDLAYTFNHMSRELASYDAENRRLIEALERGYVDTIRALAAAVDAKDPYTRGHSERVAALAVEIGRELGVPDAAIKALEHGGLLHDIGKIGIPDTILGKPAPLTPGEMALVRAHPVIGAEIVDGVEFLGEARLAIRGHHERFDGAGYPDGLRGEAIPLVARVVNIADTWDACTSRRPYQDPIPEDVVVAILDGLRGAQTDPRVHDALLAVLARRGAAIVPQPANERALA
jgi:putative nucleotidyltransferase with HDIG domain